MLGDQRGAAQRLDTTGPVLLLTGPVLVDLNWLVTLGIQVARQRDGMTPRPRLLELQRIVAAAAQDVRAAASGRADVRAAPDSPELPQDDPDAWIGTREAAITLGLSQRQVRRIATSLGTVQHGRVHLFRRLAVEAYAAHRGETA